MLNHCVIVPWHPPLQLKTVFGSRRPLTSRSAKARAFPYQLMSAFKAAASAPGILANALQQAMEIATENVPAFAGKVFVFVDVSGSMRADDIKPSRIEASQAAARKFIEEQPSNVAIGIVAFAGISVLAQAPTTEREPLYAAISNFELRRGTAVGSGLLTALRTIFPDENFYAALPGGNDPLANALGRGGNGFGNGPGGTFGAPVDSKGPLGSSADAPKPPHIPVQPGSYPNAVIVLLTDGATTTGPDPLQAGQIAADWGVKVFTVGFGSPSGAIVDFAGRSMRAQLDEPALQEIARKTDGQYFEAKSADDLTRVYSTLSTRLVGEKKMTEIAFIFAGVGAVLASAAGMLSLLWFGRLA